VRVASGEVFDVAVDLRQSSPTFGRWVGLELSAENKKMAWIPPGFAHGFYVLSEWADLPYKDRVWLDSHYVRNWSIWPDIVILARTGWVVLAGIGAY